MSFPEFESLCEDYDVIPICLDVEADLETPISAFWKLREGDSSFLLESVEGGEAWARYTFMGSNPRRVFTADGAQVTVTERDGATKTIHTDDPLATIHAAVASDRVFQPPGLPRFYGGLIGAISYDAVDWMAEIGGKNQGKRRVPDIFFLETDVILVWDNLKHRANLIYLARPGERRSREEEFERGKAALSTARERLLAPLPAMPTCSSAGREVTRSVSDADFEARVIRVKEYITAGDAIQVVVSREFNQPAGDLHPFLVYRSLRTLNPSPYMFYLEHGELCLVGASPEVLVRRTGDEVEVRPIAGTRRRGTTEQEDAELATELLADPKERAEHVMLVDLARNDIGRIARTGSVEVREEMVVERYSHVMHLVSHVRGEACEGLAVSDLIAATYPAGTLSGAPKRRAMEIIAELEQDPRGYYGGAVGTIGPTGDLDLCIAIRMMTAREGVLSVRAGAGIVYDSVPRREAEETESKAQAVLIAIERARSRFQRGRP